MRIIGGSARGRKLASPRTSDTRPVTDRAREAVFSMVGSWVEEAQVLDLYAGSGSFGLEALSRGAADCVFVENAEKALSALRSNVDAVGLGGTVVARSVNAYLSKSVAQFHLVFVDPPWPMSTEDLESVLHSLDPLVLADGEIVTSRRHADRVPNPPETWRVATNKRYGDTRIIRYEKVQIDDDGTLPREL